MCYIILNYFLILYPTVLEKMCNGLFSDSPANCNAIFVERVFQKEHDVTCPRFNLSLIFSDIRIKY